MRKLAAAFLIMVFLAPYAFSDIITLKDDQQFSADVTGFDSYYLTAVLGNNKTVNIPWREVRFVKHTTTASNWLEETYISKEDSEVDTLVTPVSEDKAFWNAVFPGLVIHGSGHFYAKNQNMGMSLMSAEIVSLIIMAVSINEVLTPVEADVSSGVSSAVFFTGLTMFAVSWVWDMIFAAPSAAEYNLKNDFLLDSEKTAAEKAAARGEITENVIVNTDAELNTGNAVTAPAVPAIQEGK